MTTKSISPILLLALFLSVPAGLIVALQIADLSSAQQFIAAMIPPLIVICAAFFSVTSGSKKSSLRPYENEQKKD